MPAGNVTRGEAYTRINATIGDGKATVLPDALDSKDKLNWSTFYNGTIGFDIVCTDVDGGSLGVVAQQVLDAYNIEYDKSFNFYFGELDGLDIKNMDATTALRYSLMEESFRGELDSLIEAIPNEYGIVEFVELGKETVNLSDIYFMTQVADYTESASAVMVTAGKPIPSLKPLVWRPIWHTAITELDGELRGAPIYTGYDMLNNCMTAEWNSYATIVFNDPQLTTAYEDGLDSLYEITEDNPWDTIIGYAVCVDPPEDFVTDKTQIAYNRDASVPLMISKIKEDGICYIGEVLYKQPTYSEGAVDEACWAGTTGGLEVDYETSLSVDIPEHLRYTDIRGDTVDQFVKVDGVYLIGIKIDALYARPKDDASSLVEMNDENSNVWVTIQSTRLTSFKLDEKKHYAIAIGRGEGDNYDVGIAFAKETRPFDNVTYGNGPDGTGCKFYLDPLCDAAKRTEFGGSVESPAGADIEQIGTIFPINKTQGILVKEVWVSIQLEAHSITIYDPSGYDPGEGITNRALRIAENLSYYVAALVMVAPPAPVGFKSSSDTVVGPLNLRDPDAIPDNDPTTAQYFSNTEMEKAMDLMSGSGFAITFSFLTDANPTGLTALESYSAGQNQAQQAAETLYNIINDFVTETVYTCGPDSEPKLGRGGACGGIINQIRYSYTDQSSYTISVTEGPKSGGNLVQVDGGPAEKMTEEVSARGTIIQAAGDNLHFKVRIDGIGDRWAINTSHSFIRLYDVVQCSIHNNPVEA